MLRLRGVGLRLSVSGDAGFDSAFRGLGFTLRSLGVLWCGVSVAVAVGQQMTAATSST